MLKAKFKYLQQILTPAAPSQGKDIDNSSFSSYKSTDEIDISHCFEQIEGMIRHTKEVHVKEKKRLEVENHNLNEQLDQSRDASANSNKKSFDAGDFEKRLNDLAAQLMTCCNDIGTKLQGMVECSVLEAKTEYSNNQILQYNLADQEDSSEIRVEQWNDIVEEVASLQLIEDDETLLVVKSAKKFYLIQESKLQQDALAFLKGFVPHQGGLLQLEKTKQVQTLETFVRELSKELVELRQEYQVYKNEQETTSSSQKSQFSKDEREYLKG